MDLSLENLFSTIIRTEREAEQEKKLCAEVKTNIETRQARLNDLKKTALELHQKIEQLEYGMSKSSTGLCIVKFKEEFLENKLKQIHQKIEENLEKLNTVENEKVLKFTNWADDFLENSRQKYEIRNNTALPAMTDTQSLLVVSHEVTDVQQEMHNGSTHNVSHPQEPVQCSYSLQDHIMEIDAQIAQEKAFIRELQLEKETLLNEPLASSEFLELRNKLVDYKTSQE